MILAELNVWHSRPAVPTRRVALGEDQLNFDPKPGSGGLLLAAVVAVHAQQLADEESNDLIALLNLLEAGARVPQPRLRLRRRATPLARQARVPAVRVGLLPRAALRGRLRGRLLAGVER